MSTPLTARTNLKTWLAAYTENPANPDRTASSYQGAPLLASDLRVLIDAFDSPCGSCHPCANYADETWRAAGRKPPHVYRWDEAQAQLKAVRELVAYCREREVYKGRDNEIGADTAYGDVADRLTEIFAEDPS